MLTVSESAVTHGGLSWACHAVTGPDSKSIVDAMVFLSSDAGPPQFKFPGPNPVSIDRSSLQTLSTDAYWLCEKTDGVRMAMICCRIKGVDVCALVDRSFAVRLCGVLHMPIALFQGSVFDGELVFDPATSTWVYLIFDAVTVSGIPVWNKHLSHRLRILERAWKSYVPDSRDGVEVRLKQFVRAGPSAAIPRGPYATDGVILTPESAHVKFGKHQGLFKLKTHHTVDFALGANGDLSVFEGRRHVTVGKLAHTLQPLPPPRSIVECSHVDLQNSTWKLESVRTDKTTANDMHTFKKTLVNIRENLGLAEVLAATRPDFNL